LRFPCLGTFQPHCPLGPCLWSCTRS